MTAAPELPALKARALKAGEDAHLHWYADDRSDDAVDPNARIRLILTDPAQASSWLAAGEATNQGDAIVLAKGWESPRPALSYVRVWADAVAGVLKDAGISVEQDLILSDKLDTASVARGLILIRDLGRISVEDILQQAKVYVSRVVPGPFVLEVTPAQAARGAGWIAASGLPVQPSGDGVRLALGTDAKAATDWVVKALHELEGSPTTTLVARFAPGAAEPWVEE